jgi:hypothetical protein
VGVTRAPVHARLGVDPVYGRGVTPNARTRYSLRTPGPCTHECTGGRHRRGSGGDGGPFSGLSRFGPLLGRVWLEAEATSTGNGAQHQRTLTLSRTSTRGRRRRPAPAGCRARVRRCARPCPRDPARNGSPVVESRRRDCGRRVAHDAGGAYSALVPSDGAIAAWGGRGPGHAPRGVSGRDPARGLRCSRRRSPGRPPPDHRLLPNGFGKPVRPALGAGQRRS